MKIENELRQAARAATPGSVAIAPHRPSANPNRASPPITEGTRHHVSRQSSTLRRA
jgi:hypothetical protein